MKSLPGILLLACLLASLASPQRVQAEEPAEPFLEALLANRYYEQAEYYLEQMVDSPLATPEFKQNVLYYQGNVLIQSARGQRDFALRQAQLDRAQEKFNQFIQQNPQSPLVPQATEQLAAIYYENALILVQRAGSQVGSQQEATNREAGEYYDKAIEVYEQRLAQIRSELEPIISQQYDPETQSDLIEQRNVLQGSYLFTMIRIPQLMFARADLFDDNSQDRTQLLEEAAGKFKEMTEKYRTLRVSYDAWFWHARCMQELGQLDEAISDYQILLAATEEDPETRALKAQALYRSMQCWLDDSIQNYDDAVDQSTAMWQSVRDNEENTPPWLALRYHLALASKRKADNDSELTGSQKTALLQQARQHAQAVARLPGEFQQPAQALLAELTGVEPEEDDDTGDQPEPTNFAEAKQYGDEATKAMQAAQLEVRALEENLANAQDEENRAEMLELKQEAEEKIIANRARATHCYELALQMADGETAVEDLNQVRFLLAYYLYTGERYYEAAVLGEFIARNFPDHGGALKCATIAMVCYQHLYKQASDAAKAAGEEGETPLDPQFASTHVLSIADYLATTWEERPEAQDALTTLIRFLVREGKLDQASEYLERINPEGSKRGPAELILGRALWTQYKQGLQLRRDVEAGRLPAEDAPDLIKLEQMKELAETSLAAGIERMTRQNQVDATLADALRSLTEIYIDTGQPAKAIPLLEGEPIGLLALLQQNHPSTQREHFASAVYLAALRAYIAVVPEQQNEEDKVAMMRKASLIMQQLKRATPNPRQLTPLYLSLARDIKTQLDLIDDPQKKAGMAQAFESFLSQVAANSQVFEELFWVADTMLSVGQSFDTDLTQEPPEAAMRLYEESVNQFNRILELNENGQLEIAPGLVLQIRARLANAYRSMRNYLKAMNEYERILRANNNMIQFQIEAAQTYEDWGASGVGVPWVYFVAIRGGRLNNNTDRYTIWGWPGIAARTSENIELREYFYQARLHWATCRLEYALAEPDKRDENLNRALGTILATNEEYLVPALSAHGDLTNDQLKEREYAQAARPLFNELMRRVQRSMGEEPTGLPPLE